jgi:hypothetical protein
MSGGGPIGRLSFPPNGAAGGTGDIVGPGSATDNALARYDGTTGKLLQSGALLESDAGMLQFGGTSASQPALRDSSGDLAVRLADDSGYAGIVSRLFACIGAGYKSKLDDSASGIVLASNGSLIGASVPSLGGVTTGDVAMVRDSAGAWRDTNGSSGIGARYCSRPIEANTAGAGSPNLLLATEARKLLTNEGAGAENYHTLPPSAPVGYEQWFACQSTNGIRVVAQAGETISLGPTLSSSAGGYVRSTVVESLIGLVKINATKYVCLSLVGTWTAA